MFLMFPGINILRLSHFTARAMWFIETRHFIVIRHPGTAIVSIFLYKMIK